MAKSKSRSLSKADLVAHFAERFDVKPAQARAFLDELASLSGQQLKHSGEFTLPGIVTLVVQKRKARVGRNPRTGEAIDFATRTVVTARISAPLKTQVSGARGLEGDVIPPRRPKKKTPHGR